MSAKFNWHYISVWSIGYFLFKKLFKSKGYDFWLPGQGS